MSTTQNTSLNFTEYQLAVGAYQRMLGTATNPSSAIFAEWAENPAGQDYELPTGDKLTATLEAIEGLLASQFSE